MENASKYESVIDSRDSKFFRFSELWEYRELFYFFTWRDVKVKYKQTAFGFLWVIFQPVSMMLIFTSVFNRRIQLPEGAPPYPVFVFSGLVLWNFFSSSVSSAGNSMVGNAHIIKKIYFPRLIIPFSSVISAGVDMLVAFGAFLVLLVWFQIPVSLDALYYWPLSLLLACMASCGLGCWLSALMVKYRDFRYVIPFLLQALLFLAPVIYPISMLDHEWAKYMLALNPMLASISSFRQSIMTETLATELYAISIVSCVFLFVTGIEYFKRTEKYFADLS